MARIQLTNSKGEESDKYLVYDRTILHFTKVDYRKDPPHIVFCDMSMGKYLYKLETEGTVSISEQIGKSNIEIGYFYFKCDPGSR